MECSIDAWPPRLPSRPVISVVGVRTQFEEETTPIKNGVLKISASNGRLSTERQDRRSLNNGRQSL